MGGRHTAGREHLSNICKLVLPLVLSFHALREVDAIRHV